MNLSSQTGRFMIQEQELPRFAPTRKELFVPLSRSSGRGTIIFRSRLIPMADAVAVEQIETPEYAPSPVLEKLRVIAVEGLIKVRRGALGEPEEKEVTVTEDVNNKELNEPQEKKIKNGFDLARSTLLLAEAVPDFAVNIHNNDERELVTQEVVDNLENGYNIGFNADKWAQSIALATLRIAYFNDHGWFVNNPENSNSDQSAALMRRNFPELVTDKGLMKGVEAQPDLFRVINSDLRLLNGIGDLDRWWEKLDEAVFLTEAFPKRVNELDIHDLKGHPDKPAVPGKFWGIMKGMLDKAKNGELIKEGNQPIDLTAAAEEKEKANKVKSTYGASAGVANLKLEDRFVNNTHAFLVIADSLIKLYPENIYDLGLSVEDIRRAEGRALDESKSVFKDTIADKLAFGEVYVSALNLEKTLGGISRFKSKGPIPQTPAPAPITKAV